MIPLSEVEEIGGAVRFLHFLTVFGMHINPETGAPFRIWEQDSMLPQVDLCVLKSVVKECQFL